MNVWGRNTTHNTHIHIHTHTYESLSFFKLLWTTRTRRIPVCAFRQREGKRDRPRVPRCERMACGPQAAIITVPQLADAAHHHGNERLLDVEWLKRDAAVRNGKRNSKKVMENQMWEKKRSVGKNSKSFFSFFPLHVLEELAVEVRAGNNFSAKFLRNFFSVNIKYKCSDHEYQSFSFSFF